MFTYFIRYCLNWGCVKNQYKEINNTDTSCYAHSGVWDHGSTGTKMKQYVREFEITDKKRLDTHVVMWEPHWTCCRKEWKVIGNLLNKFLGCTKRRHKGPILSELENVRKYLWPDDPRAKLYFPKIVSDKWKTMLEKYQLDEKNVKKIVSKFFDGGYVI